MTSASSRRPEEQKGRGDRQPERRIGQRANIRPAQKPEVLVAFLLEVAQVAEQRAARSERSDAAATIGIQGQKSDIAERFQPLAHRCAHKCAPVPLNGK